MLTLVMLMLISSKGVHGRDRPWHRDRPALLSGLPGDPHFRIHQLPAEFLAAAAYYLITTKN